jgi:APA family basic amino acid/polyamine antiporter
MSAAQRREMGFWSVFALVVNLQLGSAMFLLPRSLSAYGLWGALSWIISGFGALSLSHIFSVLSDHHPMVGGPHVYIQQAFGQRWGFYAGWTYWVVAWISSLPLILVGTTALESIMGDFGLYGRLIFQVVLLWSLMSLNIRGAKLSGLGEIIFSILKVSPLVIIPFLGLRHFNMETLTKPIEMPAFSALGAASLMTFWGFVGLEAGTTVADCVKNPKKTIPRALFLGTLLVAMLYLMNTVSIFGIVPREALSANDNAYGALFQHTWGDGWDKIIQVLVCTMCFGSLNSWILSSGQVALTAANSGLLPSFFNQVNGKNSPVMGVKITTLCLALSCAVVSLLTYYSQSFSQQIDTVVNISVTCFILLYVVVMCALMHFIRKKAISWSPLLMISVTTSTAFCLWTITSTHWSMLLGAIFIPISGYIVARLFRWSVF